MASPLASPRRSRRSCARSWRRPDRGGGGGGRGGAAGPDEGERPGGRGGGPRTALLDRMSSGGRGGWLEDGAAGGRRGRASGRGSGREGCEDGRAYGAPAGGAERCLRAEGADVGVRCDRCFGPGGGGGGRGAGRGGGGWAVWGGPGGGGRGGAPPAELLEHDQECEADRVGHGRWDWDRVPGVRGSGVAAVSRALWLKQSRVIRPREVSQPRGLRSRPGWTDPAGPTPPGRHHRPR